MTYEENLAANDRLLIDNMVVRVRNGCWIWPDGHSTVAGSDIRPVKATIWPVERSALDDLAWIVQHKIDGGAGPRAIVDEIMAQLERAGNIRLYP